MTPEEKFKLDQLNQERLEAEKQWKEADANAKYWQGVAANKWKTAVALGQRWYRLKEDLVTTHTLRRDCQDEHIQKR